MALTKIEKEKVKRFLRWLGDREDSPELLVSWMSETMIRNFLKKVVDGIVVKLEERKVKLEAELTTRIEAEVEEQKTGIDEEIESWK